MNRYFTFIFCMLLASASHVYAENNASDKGMTLSAQQWTRNVVMGWNLGNALESAGNETAWGKTSHGDRYLGHVRQVLSRFPPIWPRSRRLSTQV